MALAFPAIYLILGIKLALASRHTSGNVQRSVNQKMVKLMQCAINFWTPEFKDVRPSGHHQRIQLLHMSALREHAIFHRKRGSHFVGPLWMVSF